MRNQETASPNGQRVARPGPHNTLEILHADGELIATYYELQDGLYRMEAAEITAIVWNDDSAWMIAASSTGAIHMLTCNARHLRTLRGVQEGRVATSLHLLPDGRLFAFRGTEEIGTWENLWPSPQ